MSKQWYYMIASALGDQQGPLSDKELKALAERGGLHPDDMVRHEGMVSWKLASKVEGLFSGPPNHTPSENNPRVIRKARLTAAIKALGEFGGAYYAPDIPRHKLANAVTACHIPRTEHVLCLVDFTSFGSAKDCLAIGCDAIYWNNSWLMFGKQPGPGIIHYSGSHFANRVFSPAGDYSGRFISLGDNLYLTVNDGSIQSKVIELLSAVRDAVSTPFACCGVTLRFSEPPKIGTLQPCKKCRKIYRLEEDGKFALDAEATAAAAAKATADLAAAKKAAARIARRPATVHYHEWVPYYSNMDGDVWYKCSSCGASKGCIAGQDP